MLFGTSGEGPSFSVSEKISTLKNVIAHGLDPRKIILANGSSNIPDTIELAKCARDHNCLACLIAPPSFFKNVSDEGVLAYYRAILSQVTIPVLLYHIPQFSGVAISMQTLKTLFKEFQGIVVGIKESEGNLEFTKQITKELPNCKVFVGNEMQIYEAMQHGAAGSICAKVNVYPELILSLIKEDNTKELAKSAHVFKDRNFITCCKELLAQNDPSWRRVRPPLT
ncbi:MAG: dihydrodipicolinate synthase family protein [Verrucomicrobia bacterium]|nr:dihydrodipicolinate synthase family protein [Verrucomicrobiota bacterium]MBS0636345.1 dihydrodipicolinate synthase family protein [Verrucomicrobiota bacterium]